MSRIETLEAILFHVEFSLTLEDEILPIEKLYCKGYKKISQLKNELTKEKSFI